MTADLHHLAAAYALDALDADERRDFEAHYPTCETCSADVQQFRAVAGSLAASAATPPPGDLKARIMTEVGQTRQLSPLTIDRATRVGAMSSRMLVAAAAALIVLAGVAVTALRNSDDATVTEVVDSADAVVTVLDPLTDDLTGNLQVVWSDERDQVAVVGSRLEDVSEDLAYALWFLLDDGVAPAGLFRPENGTVSAVLDVADLDVNGWGITIEPAAGSDQPTTDVIFAGTF